MFESSEEEIESEPVLPKNDPNFQAMERDFEERSAKRRKDKKKAEELKELGNECMKKGLYRTANKHYTDAFEHRKDILPIYTNRALARLKLEMWIDAVDDCTRVLEFCEVFDNGYQKQPDLCYKALIRRAQAHRGLRDFDEAIKDCDQAAELLPNELDPAKLRAQFVEDKEHEARISRIMADSESLKGKEFIDFILDFLSGKTHQPELKPGVRLPKNCVNELKADEAKKLLEILQGSEELQIYFNVKNGFKCLVDSLYLGHEGLAILNSVLPKNQKLREDFQRQHLYEGLIDFLYKKNVKAEGSTLPNEHVHTILTLLENASMDETVRGVLSEMSKIKDLFLIVIRSVDVQENASLVSTLIQFVSNLCYGQGKFRKMLSSEPPQEFFTMIERILQLVEKPLVDKSKKKEDQDWKGEGKRSLLKQSTVNFVSNLCVDPKLRQHVAQDMGGVLTRIVSMLQIDATQQPFDWIESSTKELAVCINCGLEATALQFFSDRDIVATLEALLKQTNFSSGEEAQLLYARCMNLIAKVAKVEKSCTQIMKSKTLVLNCILYFDCAQSPDLAKQCLLTFHLLCKRGGEFRSVCFDEHKFTPTMFNAYVKQSMAKYNEIQKAEQWDSYVNICASITGFLMAFPERL